MKIAHISDLHLNMFYKDSNLQKIKYLLKYAIAQKPDHIVITGDLTDNAGEKDFADGECIRGEKMKGRLVRDKIPEIIKESGKIPITRIADEEEYKTALKEKLLEEVKEFNGSGDLEELADVLEVIHYLLQCIWFVCRLPDRNPFIRR